MKIRMIIKQILVIITAITFGIALSIIYLYIRLPIGNSRLPDEVASVLQSKGYTCGPASLVMVLRSFGIKATEEEIAKLAGTTAEKGTSMYGLKRAAESLGLEMMGMKLSMQMLKIVNKPLIAYLGTHNVVVYGIENDMVHIANPARGEIWLKTTELAKLWQGYALVPVRLKPALR